MDRATTKGGTMQGMTTLSLRSLQARELIDPRGASADGTSELLTTLERHYAILSNRRAVVASLMQEAPHDGRPPVVSAGHRLQGAGVTNGQETRASERWQATPIERLTDWQGEPLDMVCYRLVPAASGIGPMERVPFTPPVTETTAESRARPVAIGGQTYADRLRTLGADTSLASGDA